MSDGAYLRFPHLHGEHVCFVAEDDLWLAPLAAEDAAPGRAWRLTADRTRLGPPRFSPDGREIAFTSWRSLDPEIHTVPVGGGPARRLTYWGAPENRVCGWTPEGDVLAVSSHGQPFSHYTWGYRLPTDGSPGSRLPWGPCSHLAVADLEGERRTLLLTGTPPHEPASWKRYRGGAMGRLWLHGERLLADLAGHLDCPMFVRDADGGTRVAFLSDHEGVGNLYSCRPDGTGLRRHTDHADFYARHAATDGRRVVYQCAGEMWLVPDLAADSRPRRLAVSLGGPRPGRRRYQVAAANHVDSLAVDTTGRASAVCVRGSLHWLTHRDGPARTISEEPGVRVRLPEMLGDTGRIAYVTDADGEDTIEIAQLPRASGDQERRRLATGRLGRVHELASSPDGGTLAVASHDGRLLLVRTDADEPPPLPPPAADEPPGAGGDTAPADATPNGSTPADAAPNGSAPADAASGEADEPLVTELIRSVNGPVRDLAFSPDSAWLAWAHPGIGRSLRQIKIAKLADGTVLEVTGGRFEDEQPVFTSDGRYLAFLSWRGFDPVYDVHTGDLSFPLGCRPYLVPLNSATNSPFALSPEGRPAAGGLDPDDTGAEDGSVSVEAEGLESRVTPFPVTASKYSALHPVAGGGLIWLRYPISGALGETFANPADTSGRPTLEHFDLVKAKRTELTAEVDWFAVSGDGTRLVVADEDELRAVPSAEAADHDTTVYIDLRRVLHTVEPGAEWRQAFDEAGRITRAYFWEPGMCGIDWDGVLDQYRPLVERVASPDEFADLLREVLGELGTSHAYVTPSRRNEGPPHYQRAIGLLGANFARTKQGDWQVSRILPGESSDSRARSPLAGTGVREGAVLTHVDGRPVDPVAGPYPLLEAAGGTTVELTFRSPDGRGPARRVAVMPLVDDRQLRYQDWVAGRREVVRRLSDGRCGYLHIPDMGGSGWAQFNRDLRMEVSREALIVDVRGNAGGNISELVVEKLTRTILGWDLTRNAQPVSYTSNAPRGPVVAVADEATSSDGDMITAAFRLLGIGPVVGTRTWGGVVGMTGRHRLVDGTVITVPMNAAWFDAYGWDVENHGVEPDIEAQRSPLDWAEGRYVALSAAVRTALDLLERHPAPSPPDYSRVPDRRRPPLPPRSGQAD
ncbi:PDZ domain-containing protein [Streptomyces sp. OF8]|uniref:Tricorn protease homolog n=1 Tax=Streptomyces alkaliterrae TaxID=2213162 RepID=A0A5P0YSB4_9ACTN|nr:S41 family peptidase [Streptomyces alkaliterrae]MBB1262024.1 PDZ domain-containing protein [Streptomyces alkaliterrae]MQS03206.1 peptidase S41 [Streptomyces alkaliterrae]